MESIPPPAPADSGNQSRRRLALVLTAVLLLGAAERVEALSWIIPGVANAPGANGAYYVSDLTVVNTGTAEQIVTLSLIPGPGTISPQPAKYTILPGKTLLSGNILGDVWSLNGTGALRVSADGPVAVFARTSNLIIPPTFLPEAPNFKFGAALPVIEESSLLSAGEEGHSGWVTQSADAGKGDRTNVAVLFPDEAGGAATVTFVREDGKASSSVSVFYDSPRAAFLQKNLSAFTGEEVSAGRVVVRVTRGRACAYTATADNGTGDLTIFPAGRPPAVAAGVPFFAVSSGVAQVPGREGAFWETEARLANISGQGVAVTAYLLGGPGPIPRRDFFVPFGATVVIRNLLTSLFNLSGSAVGAVLWETSGPLWIGARTSSKFDDFFAKGTSGLESAAVPIDSFLTPADGPADLADIGGFRTPPDQIVPARTSLFIAAGPAGAICVFKAHEFDGRLLGSNRISLPALGWGEFNLASLFAGVPAPLNDLVRVRVSVESGSANVQAAVKAFDTHDPFLYEAFPLAPAPHPPSPPLSPGVWGSSDGTQGLKVDATKIVVDRWCRSGIFPQPPRLDSFGRFAVIGDYVVNIGPVLGFTAILSGATDGQTATVSILQLDGTPFDMPVTYVLGNPYKIAPGPCPVEY
jgi:hypothetical protein